MKCLERRLCKMTKYRYNIGGGCRKVALVQLAQVAG